MIKFSSLNWPLVIGLGAFALIRPVTRIVTDQAGISTPAAIPVGLTVAITVVWVLVVGLSRVRQPVLTLVGAGLTYAVLATVLSAILSPLLTGSLQGPLTHPFAIVSVLVINAIWGGVAGLLGWGVQRLRGVRHDEPVG